MNAERLLEHYEKIAEAPDAIPKLRRFILDLAVRGKLVPQDPNDEPAEELLKRIEAEKKRLASEANSRRQKQPSTSEPAPFSVRSNWSWTTLSEVGFLNPRNDAGDTTLASFVPMTLIAAEYGQPNQHEIRPWSEIKKGYTHFAEGDVGLAKITPCFENGKSTVFRKLTGGIGAGTTELHIVRPILIDPQYILIFLKSPHFIDRGIPRMTGTAGQKRVPTEYFASAPFPLPPLAEQQRIVAKVDELMGICDRLEVARKEREAIRDGFTTSTLGRLSVADESTFRSDASFAIEHLRELTTRPDQIKQLRQTILNLAVRGKFSQKEDWQLKPIRLGDVATLQNGYAFKSEWFARSGIRLLRNVNVGHGRVNWNESVCISEAKSLDYERFTLHPGDVILSLDRPFIVTGTKVARIMDDDVPSLLLQRVGRFVTTSSILPEFLYLWIKSPEFSRQIDPGRSNGVPHISSKQVETAVFYLPPITEQRRIVALADSLLAICRKIDYLLHGDLAEATAALEQLLFAKALS